MSDVALLMSIRDQLKDALLAVRAVTQPDVYEGEEAIKQWRGWLEHPLEETVLKEQHNWSRDFRPEQIKTLKRWNALKPIHITLQRLDKYIKAAGGEP